MEDGLTLITRGSDPKLSALATKDLTNPRSVAEMTALADGYYDFASDKMARPILRKLTAASRAGFWYAKISQGAGGLLKAHGEKRLVECEALFTLSLSRQAACNHLRQVVLASNWTWHGPDVIMSFHHDGSVNHRGMNGRYEVQSPRQVTLYIDNGDIMPFWFNAALDRYRSLGKDFGGERVAH